jgi:hypothetical protein
MVNGSALATGLALLPIVLGGDRAGQEIERRPGHGDAAQSVSAAAALPAVRPDTGGDRDGAGDPHLNRA